MENFKISMLLNNSTVLKVVAKKNGSKLGHLIYRVLNILLNLSDLCDYSDAYIFVKGRISVTDTNAKRRNKKLIFKNNAPFR